MVSENGASRAAAASPAVGVSELTEPTSGEYPRERRPPGPAPRPGGLLGKVRYGLNFLLDPMGFVAGRFERYGDIYFVGAEDEPGLFVIKDPALVHEVLVTRARSFEKKHSAFDILSNFLGPGLLTTDGETWRRQRRLVQPAFSKARLEGYTSIMGEEIAHQVARYESGGERDVSADMMELTLRIVTRSLFGQATSSSDVAVVREAMHVLQNGLISLPLPIPDWASPLQRRMKKAMAGLNDIIEGMIDRRRQEGIAGRNDLLSVLLGAVDEEGDGKGMSTEEIKAQLVTLFLAGHETTSNALTWSLYLLADNPEVEAKLHLEVDEVLGGRAPTYADYARLPYTRQALKESMRLFPPLYLMARMAAEDVFVGPWCIPKGSEVVLWTYHVQRDPSLFVRPWEFRPERFSPQMEATIPKGAYFPFGAGPRACIGTQFALIEGTLALAALAASYRFRLPPGHDVQLAPRLTLSPKGGLPMTVEPRRR